MLDRLGEFAALAEAHARVAFASPATYTQLGIILAIYAIAFVAGSRIRKYFQPFGSTPKDETQHPLKQLFAKLGSLIVPLLAILMLRISLEITQIALQEGWLVQTALAIAMLLLFNSIVTNFLAHAAAARIARWVGIPLLILHLLGLLSELNGILESISISVGNIEVSAYGVARVTIFGSLFFWLGLVSSRTARGVITRQDNLDLRTREIASKMLEIGIFSVVVLLVLQVMGINLTALAVFGGALGVGIGFGLQAIASNFISGIIILLDRSVTLGDYVELQDGPIGIVRELSLRSTTLETFDGKDVVVPNEKFIVEVFTNWTHKDKRQRYRVDFSVAYATDIRKLVDIIKDVVSSHPQVISGEDIPIWDRPDCEIDSFGDSGVNMFVEFWMEGIDDGRNRVGGDLLLMIFEALRTHGIEIPFPQREVRVVNDNLSIKKI